MPPCTTGLCLRLPLHLSAHAAASEPLLGALSASTVFTITQRGRAGGSCEAPYLGGPGRPHPGCAAAWHRPVPGRPAAPVHGHVPPAGDLLCAWTVQRTLPQAACFQASTSSALLSDTLSDLSVQQNV